VPSVSARAGAACGGTLPGVDLVNDADAIAAQVMSDAGVEIVELSTDEQFETFSDLADEIWQRDEKWIAPERVASRAAAGGYVVGMYELSSGRMIGLSLGYPDSEEPEVLYKDISGMVPDVRGEGRFRSLLMYERAWGFRNGFETMQGSFDPLLRRNAWLNIERRAQHVTEYVVNKYGTPSVTSVNGVDDTDRFTVRWNIRSRAVIDALEGRRPAPDEAQLRTEGAVDLVSDDGHVVAHPDGDGPWLCSTPEDIVALRTTEPESATRWRLSVREVMVEAFARGVRATGATPSGRYVLTTS